MAAGAQAPHQTIPNVDPSRDTDAIAGLNRAASRKKPIDSQLALKWLKSILRPSRSRGCDSSAKRQNDGNEPAPEHGERGQEGWRARPRQSAIV